MTRGSAACCSALPTPSQGAHNRPGWATGQHGTGPRHALAHPAHSVEDGAPGPRTCEPSLLPRHVGDGRDVPTWGAGRRGCASGRVQVLGLRGAVGGSACVRAAWERQKRGAACPHAACAARRLRGGSAVRSAHAEDHIRLLLAPPDAPNLLPHCTYVALDAKPLCPVAWCRPPTAPPLPRQLRRHAGQHGGLAKCDDLLWFFHLNSTAHCDPQLLATKSEVVHTARWGRRLLCAAGGTVCTHTGSAIVGCLQSI